MQKFTPCSSTLWPPLGAWFVQQPAHLFIFVQQSDRGDYKSQAAGANVPPRHVAVALPVCDLTDWAFVFCVNCGMRCLCHWTTLWGDTLPVSSPLLCTWKVRQTIAVMPSVKKLCLKKMLLLLLSMLFSGDQMYRKKTKTSLHSVSCSSEHCKTKCVPDETSLWEALSKYVSGFPIFFSRATWYPVFYENVNQKNITRHPL